MQADTFVQNVKKYCELKGVKPTVACAESGAGKSLLSQLLNRGVVPSVAKVQLLAQYLGCTVSDLLGETGSAPPQSGSELQDRIDALTPQEQEKLRQFAEFLLLSRDRQ